MFLDGKVAIGVFLAGQKTWKLLALPAPCVRGSELPTCQSLSTGSSRQDQSHPVSFVHRISASGFRKIQQESKDLD